MSWGKPKATTNTRKPYRTTKRTFAAAPVRVGACSPRQSCFSIIVFRRTHAKSRETREKLQQTRGKRAFAAAPARVGACSPRRICFSIIVFRRTHAKPRETRGKPQKTREKRTFAAAPVRVDACSPRQSCSSGGHSSFRLRYSARRPTRRTSRPTC